MKPDNKSELNAETCTTERLAHYLGLSERQVQKLHNAGVLTKASRGQYPIAENIQAFINYKSQPENFSDEENKFRLANLKEDARRKKRENDIAEKLVAPVDHMLTVIRPVMSRLSQAIDLLPGVAADACNEVDGRGRERMANALINEKNEIARIPDRMLEAVESLS